MNDKDYDFHKARIGALADKWLPMLGLEWWTIDIEYHRAGISNGEEDWTTNARCNAKWEYMRATIAFNMLAVMDLSSDELERIFVHECCHILVCEMREWGPEKMLEAEQYQSIKHEERVVVGLTKAFLWTYERVKKNKADPPLYAKISREEVGSGVRQGKPEGVCDDEQNRSDAREQGNSEGSSDGEKARCS